MKLSAIIHTSGKKLLNTPRQASIILVEKIPETFEVNAVPLILFIFPSSIQSKQFKKIIIGHLNVTVPFPLGRTPLFLTAHLISSPITNFSINLHVVEIKESIELSSSLLVIPFNLQFNDSLPNREIGKIPSR